jgi:hypothetical protein
MLNEGAPGESPVEGQSGTLTNAASITHETENHHIQPKVRSNPDNNSIISKLSRKFKSGLPRARRRLSLKQLDEINVIL